MYAKCKMDLGILFDFSNDYLMQKCYVCYFVNLPLHHFDQRHALFISSQWTPLKRLRVKVKVFYLSGEQHVKDINSPSTLIGIAVHLDIHAII